MHVTDCQRYVMDMSSTKQIKYERNNDDNGKYVFPTQCNQCANSCNQSNVTSNNINSNTDNNSIVCCIACRGYDNTFGVSWPFTDGFGLTQQQQKDPNILQNFSNISLHKNGFGIRKLSVFDNHSISV